MKANGRTMIAAVVATALAACGEADEATIERSGPSAPIEAEAPLVQGEQRTIIAFGDSLFAGYNVPKDKAYPAMLQNALRARGIDARVVNAGVSGDTSRAGRDRLNFILDAQETPPDLFILELGGNDLLRGLSPVETRANLSVIIEEVQGRGIDIILFGLAAPPNLGADYLKEFSDVFASLSKEYSIPLVPNWVESVAQRPELIQSDRVHPTEDGIAQLVEATTDEVVQALPAEPS